MTTYLYCVLTSTGTEPPAIVGVGGAPIRALALDRASALEAWVATVSDTAFRLSGRELELQAVVHNDVVAAALALGRTPLPARFGCHFASDDACITALAARAVELRSALTRLTGMVEMSVLIVPPRWHPPVESTPEPKRHERDAGRRYLELVRERTRRVDALRGTLAAVIHEIGTAVGDMVQGQAPPSRSADIVSIAHLLRSDDAARYRDVVRSIRVPDGVRLVVAGPRAPYSFVGPDTLSTGHDSGSPNVNAWPHRERSRE